MTKAALIVDDLGIVPTAVGASLARFMAIRQEELAVVT